MFRNWKRKATGAALMLLLPPLNAQAAINAQSPVKVLPAIKVQSSLKEPPAIKEQSSLSSPATESTEASTSAQPEDSVRGVLLSLEAAIASKNSENAVALFGEDATFIDQTGEEVRGQKALRERFDQLFKAAASTGVGIHPHNITFPASNVAIVVGEVSRKREQTELPESRFGMVMVKKSGNWLINEITETAMQSARTESRLQELNWMIGQWTAEKPDTSAQMTVEWAPSKKFIMSKCTVFKHGMQPEVDTQVIGWDPQHQSIISWHFDSNGGFGNGTWSKQSNPDKWTVEVVGVGADGHNTTASNVFTLKTSDEFTWQSISRSIDGVAVDDTDPVTVHRVKQ